MNDSDDARRGGLDVSRLLRALDTRVTRDADRIRAEIEAGSFRPASGLTEETERQIIEHPHWGSQRKAKEIAALRVMVAAHGHGVAAPVAPPARQLEWQDPHARPEGR